MKIIFVVMATKLTFIKSRSFWTMVVSCLFLFSTAAFAATVQVPVMEGGLIAANVSMSADTLYTKDKESVELVTIDSKSGVSARVFGRNFAEDGLAKGRYGLLDANSPKNWKEPGILIRGGLGPVNKGALTHQYLDGKGTVNEVAASYVALHLDAPQGSLFTSVRVDLNGLDFSKPSNVWAGSSSNDFTTAAIPSVSLKGRETAFSFDVNIDSKNASSVEIRLYGLSGADEAQLMNLTFAASLIAVGTIPEPSTSFVLLLSGVVWLRKRKR